jgi:tetratricopeptide (TPR) repeat protein
VVLGCVALGAPAGVLLQRRLAGSGGGAGLPRVTVLLGMDALGPALQARRALEKLPPETARTGPALAATALLHASLGADLGGGTSSLTAAATSLRDLGQGPAARTGIALMARLLVRASGTQEDPAVEEDLAQARAASPLDPWLEVTAGRLAEETGDDPAAAHHLRRAVRMDPSLPVALHGLARAHARLGDLAEARRLALLTLDRVPHHARALSLGLLASRTEPAAAEPFEKAARAALAARDAHPHDTALVAMTLGLLALARNDAAAAAPFLEQASNVLEDPPGWPWVAARVRLAAGDVEAAADLLERAARVDPDNLPLHADLCRARAVAARGPGWVKALRADFRAKSDATVLRFPLGTVTLLPGAVRPWDTTLQPRHFPEAELAAALAGPGADPRATAARLVTASTLAVAESLLFRGSAAEARTLLLPLLPEQKRNPDYLLLLARASAASGEAREAERHARLALDASRNDPRPLVLLASLQVDQGDAAGALKTLARLDTTGWTSPRALALKARALGARGQAGPARQALKEARDLDPSDPEVALASASEAMADGNDEAALQSYRRLARSSPPAVLAVARANPRTAPVIGKALYDAGAKSEALELLRQAVKDDPEEPRALFMLGVTLAAERENRAALEMLRRYDDVADVRDPHRAEAARAMSSLGGKARGTPRGKPRGRR